ncbi:thiol methyltransferase 2 [Trichoderma arundinaceum]|uniref:Thiol methyltransferase 2 n=1 Tax=Trichoderma arundinaceum TaxID=490622 RepID=A0A395N9V0_TRIAR|nr:thiol methyltransferase 2 [Trichoderma arundinaceum]
MASAPAPYDHPAKLRDAFASRPVAAHNDTWDSLYAESFHPWDRAGPSLALADLIAQRTDLIPPSLERDPRGNPLRDSAGAVIRRSALIPGCGLGHDVLLLSSLGYNVVGLDYSQRALGLARENQDKALHEGRYKSVEEGVDGGRVTWVSGDFFGNKWEGGAGGEATAKFDLIYDYTHGRLTSGFSSVLQQFLCALQPSERPRWAKRMSQLLAPGGQLICLEFPSGKPLSQQGPPWGVWPEVYEALLAYPGEPVEYTDDGNVKPSETPQQPHPDALHRVCLVKPPRTHKAGTNEDGSVRDFISVWSR